MVKKLIMTNFDFDNTGFANDFEAIIDANEVFDWIPEYKYIVWLKAYDSSVRENEREIEVNDSGYGFDCYAYIILEEDGSPVAMSFEPRMAKTRHDAENTLIKMSSDIAKDNDIIERLRSLL